LQALGVIISFLKFYIPFELKRRNYFLDVVRVSHNFIAGEDGREYFDFQAPCGDQKTEDFFTGLVNDMELMAILFKFMQDPNRKQISDEDDIVVIDFNNKMHDDSKYFELKSRTGAKMTELFDLQWLRVGKKIKKTTKLLMAFVYEHYPEGGNYKIRLMTITEPDLKKCQLWKQEDDKRAEANKEREFCKGKGGIYGLMHPFKQRKSRWKTIQHVFMNHWGDQGAVGDGHGILHIEMPDEDE
jgi:hypothetical protein